MAVYRNFMEILKIHKRQWPQIYCILIACFSGIVYGLAFAWTSPSIPKITQDKENYDITEKEAAYFTIIPYLAMAVSVLPFSYLNDIIGRKLTIMLMVIPCIVHWIIIIFARSVYLFYLARLFIGVTEFLFISLPMYVGEISSPTIRGTWGSYCSIQQTGYICLMFCLILVMLLPLIPDTPYYYIIKRDESKAKKTLKWLYQEDNVEDTFQSIKSDVEKRISDTGTWSDLFKIKSNRDALISCIFVQLAIPFSGFTAFVGYSQQIFNKTGGEISAETSSIIIQAIISVVCIFTGFTADKIGRKRSFKYSAFSCTILLLIEGLYFWCEQYSPNITKNCHWIPLCVMIMFYIIHTIGIGTVSILMLEELFSANVKTKGLCLCTFVFGVGGALNNELFNELQFYFGMYASFMFFACTCAVLFILSFRLIPETSGKTLQEIQQSFKIEQTNNK
ncbi:facilitated trehalose transporter Tret1-like isoform X2 [Aethina tumida]|uniref:facilitated trehalose transporter Tret1-like isoform X2 n=1 Tax=Aethina tumida TaxID=116153 RepID=UPI00214898C2|nr:facilitated trehalose transporter Tret1-like isoform X2 [Aethina tumida]